MEVKLKSFQVNRQAHMKRIIHSKVKAHKTKLFSQKGKGKGLYRIKRGAETALYMALEEQLSTHSRRRGCEQLEKRIYLKEMRAIANKWLKTQGHSTIKSYETCRSWQKPRSISTRQAKQHRGKGLFKRRKPQKDSTDTHINVHYNRAHVKQYTRFLFSKCSQYRDHAIRRCFDNKAFVRCGTSEGFLRISTKPVMLTGQELKLPTYDFADSVGYVAPGVNLIIEDMEESQLRGRDTFAISDATINVTCKPKLLHKSSATNWANDAYHDRLLYPEQHETKDQHDAVYQPDLRRSLTFLKDTLKQYELMSIEEDLVRVVGGSHLDREILRNTVILERSLSCVEIISNEESLHKLSTDIHDFILDLRRMIFVLNEDNMSAHDVLSACLKQKAVTLEKKLQEYVQRHRPIDIQTTDGGPGVGTTEKLVCLRLVESFLINDLDLQARMHYARYDSKTHPVERVMSSLTNALGDGRCIDVPKISILDHFTEQEILLMTKEDITKFEDLKKRDIAVECAEKVASRYAGTRCMNTFVNACIPHNDYSHFYFDEKYMLQCKDAKSRVARAKCAGLGYYTFLENTFKTTYRKYHNGVEGIRQDGKFRCPLPIKRVPPPVPDTRMSELPSWLYHTPDTLPEVYKDVESRNVDDFCPSEKLAEFIDSVGQPDIVVEDKDGIYTARDTNNTWESISNGLCGFIEQYIGKDLTDVVHCVAKEVFTRKLLKMCKEVQEQRKHMDNGDTDIYKVMQTTEPLKIYITRQMNQPPPPLPWNGKTGGITTDNKRRYPQRFQ